jgi:sigma-B regulation protein RsbU (phosphoserine phosphatase)
MTLWTRLIPHRLRPKTFRMKFLLVVGAAVFFDVLLSGSVAVWNVKRLSAGASQQVEQGLTKANEEYLRNYIETTAMRVNLLFDRVNSDVKALAFTQQTLIDHPAAKDAISVAIARDPYFAQPLSYNRQRQWSQNKSGPAVISVWGYLHDSNGNLTPEARGEVSQSALFNLFGQSSMAAGADKLQVYYVGPRDTPIMRTVPFTDQAGTFDKLYPGHNKADWWNFFFPGLLEAWKSWRTQPSARPVASEIVQTQPYVDAITGHLIVSFFHPLWTRPRTDVAGMVAADIELDQLADIVKSVKVAESGFAFLTMSNGNVIAINSANEAILGLSRANGSNTQGVTGADRMLKASSQRSIRSLVLPRDDKTAIKRLTLMEKGKPERYIVTLRRLDPSNLWSGSAKLTREYPTLAFVVPEREVYATLIAAQQQIEQSTGRIVKWQVATFLFSFIVILFVVFGISKQITAGLSQLAEAARRLKDKDYSVRVELATEDEVGEVGVAFNSMAEEIRFHTENLEHKVEERTRELGAANDEILKLNQKLKNENLRLGAELEVGRRVQKMVEPRNEELDALVQLEIARYMEPADEVGGDYYDVLTAGDRIKIGIGDVTGHGLESGVLMLMVQSVALSLLEQGEADPKRFLSVLNRVIYRNVERTGSGKYLSLAFLDYADGMITLCGQHEEVLVLRSDGTVDQIDTMDLGFPVGLELDIADFVAVNQFAFASGDVIVLHTDGVTEAESPDGTLFGMERLVESAQRHRSDDAEAMKQGIIDDLMKHIETQKIHDDITLIVIRHR